MRAILLTTGMILLFIAEVLKSYFTMPFAGSFENDALAIGYFFSNNIVWLRILAVLLIAYPLYSLVKNKKIKPLFPVLLLLAGYVAVYYYLNVYVLPEEVYQPIKVKTFASKKANKISSDKMVIGVNINGQAKAYPLQIIGYHHHITDTVNGVPIIVTYCTVCRSARVFDAEVDGQTTHFRLVGMNKYNALFKDDRTDSWWQQATGKAVAGPLKNKVLREIPSQQVTLSSWLKRHPDALVMQPDTNYLAAYRLTQDDKAFFRAKYSQHDSAAFKAKSMVIGIVQNNVAKAYDFDRLNRNKIIEDSVNRLPLLITVEADNASVHTLNRNVNGVTHVFEKTDKPNLLKDVATQSIWNLEGTCIEGRLEGTQLEEVQSYVETWQSWSEFHPGTAEYEDAGEK